MLMHTMDYVTDRARDGDATAEQEAMAFAIYDKVKSPAMDRPIDFTPKEARLLFDEMNRALRNIAQNGENLQDEKALCLSILTKVQTA